MDRLPAFYFDLASLEAYLSAERILSLMPAPVEWVGVGASGLAAPSDPATQVELARDRIASRGLQELRLPDPFPFDSRRPMLAATYARQIGRAVPFALAAWRQSFAAGRTLDDDGIAIAGSSCEMHPTALLKAIETATVADELEAGPRARGARRAGGLGTGPGRRARPRLPRRRRARSGRGGRRRTGPVTVSAARSYEVKVTRAGIAPGRLASPGRFDLVEVISLEDMEVVLFWDVPARETARMEAALREELARMGEGEFLSRWSAVVSPDDI